MRAFISRTLATMRLLAEDERIPRPLRWLAGLGLLPVPGPFDEALLLLLAPVLLLLYRQPLREAWMAAGERRRGRLGGQRRTQATPSSTISRHGRSRSRSIAR